MSRADEPGPGLPRVGRGQALNEGLPRLDWPSLSVSWTAEEALTITRMSAAKTVTFESR